MQFRAQFCIRPPLLEKCFKNMLKKHQTILLKQLFKTLKQLEALFCKLSQDHKEVL